MDFAETMAEIQRLVIEGLAVPTDVIADSEAQRAYGGGHNFWLLEQIRAYQQRMMATYAIPPREPRMLRHKAEIIFQDLISDRDLADCRDVSLRVRCLQERMNHRLRQLADHGWGLCAPGIMIYSHREYECHRTFLSIEATVVKFSENPIERLPDDAVHVYSEPATLAMQPNHVELSAILPWMLGHTHSPELPPQELTTDSLRELLGAPGDGQLEPAKFNAEGGFRFSEN